MKRTIFIWTLLSISLSIMASGIAKIQFESKSHDFGRINEDDKTATYEFVFKNDGNGPLIIHKAVASCGCTTPEFTKEPIAAGKFGTIKVTYNTTGRPGAFHKTITIYSNDPDAPNVILSINGTVIPSSENPEASYPKNMQGLRLNKNQVSILDAKTGSVRYEKIDVINTNSKAIKLSFKKVPSHIRITASNTLLQPKETGTINIAYSPSGAKDFGRREDSFYIAINNDNKHYNNNRINVSAYITEDFSHMTAANRTAAPVVFFSENRLNFGKMVQKDRKVQSLSLSNNGKSPLIIRKIVPEYEGLKVTPEKKVVAAGETIKVKLDFNAGTFNGNVVQRVSFFTNDPKNSISRIFVMAQVTPA